MFLPLGHKNMHSSLTKENKVNSSNWIPYFFPVNGDTLFFITPAKAKKSISSTQKTLIYVRETEVEPL